MMLNALAGLMMIPNPATTKHPFTDLLLAGGPKTHTDGSVTWNPPARYDRPFDGTETIKRLPQSEVVEACRRLFADAGLDVKVTSTQKGCAVFKGKDGTIIVIDKPFMGVTPEAAIRHERGHLNGWKQDHPD
jgi:hypothetical protein